MNILSSELFAIAPLISLTIVSLIVLLTEALVKQSERLSYWISIIGLFVTSYLAIVTMPLRGTVLNSMIIIGGYSSYFSIIFCSAALFTIIFSKEYLNYQQSKIGEFYLLIIFSTIGMMLMASAADLILLFIGLELMSICLYVLAGFFRNRQLSNEAALKYFLLGAFATSFLLYGIALVYGATGSTNIDIIVQNLTNISNSYFMSVGIGLILIGLAFKVGAVPFHMWVPDVYQGSPTPISGFMATGAKAAAFSAFVVLFINSTSPEIKTVLILLSALSMIVGNIIAISQNNVKRMLAYSSIAHAGYMLSGLAAANQLGRDGILFYLLSYMLMNVGAFGVISMLETGEEKNLSFDDYKGLGTKKPALAAILSVLMFSLAGIPPFAGFFGKYYIFISAVNSNLTWLAILGVLTSVISVYYYLRLVVVMYFKGGEEILPAKVSQLSYLVLIAIIIFITGIGVYPSSILSIINQIP
ncbi:MAG: NADH-quinone oxidoreductase subunit N [Ignavibacteriales bacterium]|nr:NADH-quinone oxidoreductase subunit N [Ignavibacteriales bacterium]